MQYLKGIQIFTALLHGSVYILHVCLYYSIYCCMAMCISFILSNPNCHGLLLHLWKGASKLPPINHFLLKTLSQDWGPLLREPGRHVVFSLDTHFAIFLLCKWEHFPCSWRAGFPPRKTGRFAVKCF